MNRIAAVWPFKKKAKNDPNDPVPPYTPPYDPTMEPFIQGISSASHETRLEIYNQLIAAGYSHAAASSFLDQQQLENVSRQDQDAENWQHFTYAPDGTILSTELNYNAGAASSSSSSIANSSLAHYPQSHQHQAPPSQTQQDNNNMGVEEYEAALLEIVLQRSAEEARIRAAEEADNEAFMAALLASTALEAESSPSQQRQNPGKGPATYRNSEDAFLGRASTASSFSIPTDHGEGPSLLSHQSTYGRGVSSKSIGVGGSNGHGTVQHQQ
ncbi:hypothetical protein BC829DRAFT_81656 [Chytridium lagenaria]|nr:hypothetical protein BC829DRAFT_81656 [Chytridium lagenaria]